MAVSRSTALPYPPPPGLDPDEPDTPETPLEPSEPVGVTVTADELAAETGLSAERAERLLAVATATVQDYAPAAPTVLLNEAVIRYAGYLGASDYGAVRSESAGPLSLEYQLNHAAAFRNSGAAMLLTRHKVRRAGSVG